MSKTVLHTGALTNRRQALFAIVSACVAVGISGRSQAQAAAPANPAMPMGPMSSQECIDICLKSHAACMQTARYCMEKAGATAAPARLALLLDCAEMCQTSADSLLRHSSEHGAICTACAQLCEACAKSCNAVADDEQLQSCATTCRDCAKSCRGMSHQLI